MIWRKVVAVATSNSHFLILLALTASALLVLRRHDQAVRDAALAQRQVDSLHVVVDSTLTRLSTTTAQIKVRDDSIAQLTTATMALQARQRLATGSARRGVDTLRVLLPDTAGRRVLDGVVAGYETALASADSVHQTDTRIIAFQRVTIAQQDTTIGQLTAQVKQALRLNDLLVKRRPSRLGQVAVVAGTVIGCALVSKPC